MATLFVGLAGMAGPFFQHLWDAQQIGDLAGREVFLHPAKNRYRCSLPPKKFLLPCPNGKHISVTV
jgi:hypothetical protein